MPFTFNGIGTILYGARDFGPDGSYVTTEWISVVYVPVVPLTSRRIPPTGPGTHYGVYNSSTYVILEDTGLNARQVLSVYGWFGSIAASFALASQFEVWWLAIPSVLMLPVPWILRKRAIRRMVEEHRRKMMGLSATSIG